MIRCGTTIVKYATAGMRSFFTEALKWIVIVCLIVYVMIVVLNQDIVQHMIVVFSFCSKSFIVLLIGWQVCHGWIIVICCNTTTTRPALRPCGDNSPEGTNGPSSCDQFYYCKYLLQCCPFITYELLVYMKLNFMCNAKREFLLCFTVIYCTVH